MECHEPLHYGHQVLNVPKLSAVEPRKNRVYYNHIPIPFTNVQIFTSDYRRSADRTQQCHTQSWCTLWWDFQCLTKSYPSSSPATSNIGRARNYTSTCACRTAVQCLVFFRVDYCCSQLHHLQLVQNRAARLITHPKPLEHITPVPAYHHWLPVHLCIEFRLLVAYSNASTSLLQFTLKKYSVPSHLSWFTILFHFQNISQNNFFRNYFNWINN